MAGVFIDIPGVGNVEAKNAATESTLREILKAMQGVQKNTGGSGGGGGGGGGSPGGGSGGLSKMTGAAGNALGKFTGLTFKAGSAMLGLALNSANVIEQFAGIGDSVEKAAAIFKGIPVIGPVFGAVAKAATETVDAYQKATASGAAFGGSLQTFSASASAAGMTMKDFGAIVAKNGEAMMMLGGTTEAGAMRFAQLGKEIRNSQVGTQLLAMGYTTEQVNSGMANYIKTMGSSGALQGKSNKEIAAGAGAYMKEIDALAKATGKQRSEIENEIEARAKDAQWIAMTQGMDKDQRMMMESFVSSFPKSQQAAIKDMITTGNITSDAAVKFNAMMGGTAQEVMQMGQAINSGRKLTQAEIDKTKNNSIVEAQQKRASAEFKTMGQYVGEFGDTVGGINELANQEVGGRKKALTEQEKAQANAASQIEKFKNTLAGFSNTFQTALVNSGVLGSLMSLFTQVADIVLKFVVPAFNFIAAIIPKVVSGFELLLAPAVEAISKLLGGSLTNAFNTVDKVLNTVFPIVDAVVRGVILQFEGLWQGVTALFDPLERLFDAVFGGGETVSTFTDMILEAGDFIGGMFTFVGTILGGVIDGLTWLVGTVKDVINKSEFLSSVFNTVSNGFRAGWDALKMLFSANGAKLLMNNIADFFGRAVGGFIEMIQDEFIGLFANILQLIGKIPGFGDLAEKGKAMQQGVEDRAKARELAAQEAKQKEEQLKSAAKAEVDARNEKVANHKKGIEEDTKKFKAQKSHNAKLGDANKETEKAKEKEAELKKSYDDPLALLKQEAQQQKSGFIKDGGTGTATAGGEAVKKQIEAAKEEAEKKADAKIEAEKMKSTGSPTPTQESSESLLASLNTKLDQLIKINKNVSDLNERQLSVQKSLSGDLYQGLAV